MMLNLEIPADYLAMLAEIQSQNKMLIEGMNRSVWLTPEMAAERLAVSVQTLTKWRKEGWLRFCESDKIVRYRADWLDEDFEGRYLVKATIGPLMTTIRRRSAA